MGCYLFLSNIWKVRTVTTVAWIDIDNIDYMIIW